MNKKLVIRDGFISKLKLIFKGRRLEKVNFDFLYNFPEGKLFLCRFQSNKRNSVIIILNLLGFEINILRKLEVETNDFNIYFTSQP